MRLCDSIPRLILPVLLVATACTVVAERAAFLAELWVRRL